MSIGEYSNSLRMTTAVNLLSTTNLRIEEIAHMVGYHYCPNFIKILKKPTEKHLFPFVGVTKVNNKAY
jgi:transcriptional regulator GlxA family with amidase domain